MPTKTRHQRLQEAEAGAQPSPPRSLVDEPRAKRARTNKSSAPTASSQHPPGQASAAAQTSTSARAPASRRGAKAIQRVGKGKGRVRPATSALTQTPEDALEASDILTQHNNNTDSHVSTQQGGETAHSTEDDIGETSPSHLDSEATHPVSAGTPMAHLMNEAVREVQAPRSSSDATHPVCAATPSPMPTGAPPAQEKRPLSKTSELFRQIMSSPSSPTPSATMPRPSIQPRASHSRVEAAHPVPSSTPPSVCAQPVPQGPMAPPSPPVMPKVYGLPAVRSQNYSLVHILLDSLPATTRKDSTPRKGMDVAFAIPSSDIKNFLSWASRNNSELRSAMKQHPVAASTKEPKLTFDPFLDLPKSDTPRKRKRNEAEGSAEAAVTHDEAARSMGKAMRSAFVRMADERRRAVLGESRLQAKSPEVEESGEMQANLRKNSDHPYTYDEVPDPQESPSQDILADPQDRVQEEQVLETPRARRWGLSSLIPSVSRFIPFSSRRTPSATGIPPRIMLDSQAPTQGAATEPPRRNTALASRHEAQDTTPSKTLAERVHKEKPRKSLLTKRQREERQQLKEEKEQIRAERRLLMEEEARIAQEKKDWEEERARVTATQTPGTKRKRVPSPEFYPLPARGFGLVDAIFEYDSDESFEEEADTPTKPRPIKKVRFSPSSFDDNRDSTTPRYEAGSFARAGASVENVNSNVFSKTATPAAGVLTKTPPAPGKTTTPDVGMLTKTPTGPFRNSFKVPSPTDSDYSEEEEDVDEGANTTPRGRSPTSRGRSPGTQDTASAQLPTQQGQPSEAVSPSPSKMMPPPPPPTLGRATSTAPAFTSFSTTLPTAPAFASLSTLEKAREKALKHQPKYSSNLRATSRLSSSPMGTETAIQPSEEDTPDESQYDPRRPAMLPNVSPSTLNQAKPAYPNYHATNGKDTTTVRHGHAPWDGLGFAYNNYRKEMTPNVEAHIEVTWDEEGDDVLTGVGDEEFGAGFEAWQREQESEDVMSGDAQDPSTSNHSELLSYEKADISSKVRAVIDSNLTEEDVAMGIHDFDEEYEAWIARETQMQGTLMPSITA